MGFNGFQLTWPAEVYDLPKCAHAKIDGVQSRKLRNKTWTAFYQPDRYQQPKDQKKPWEFIRNESWIWILKMGDCCFFFLIFFWCEITSFKAWCQIRSRRDVGICPMDEDSWGELCYGIPVGWKSFTPVHPLISQGDLFFFGSRSSSSR